jgi:anti-sigma factor RsiW
LPLSVPSVLPECCDVLVFVHRYVDGECDLETALAVAAHLDACPECGYEVLEIRWLKAAVRRCGRCPDE